MLVPTIDEIRSKLCTAAFGDSLISNIYRGLVAEIIVGAALDREWRMCSADWQGWDFEHPGGTKLEVKQSAARQTWTGMRGASTAIFDIRARTGYFEGADWTPDPRRFADIYVFAHHPITDSSADHRDARQWRFYVVEASRLPSTKTLRLTRLATPSAPLLWEDLRGAIESMRTRLDHREERL